MVPMKSEYIKSAIIFLAITSSIIPLVFISLSASEAIKSPYKENAFDNNRSTILVLAIDNSNSQDNNGRFNEDKVAFQNFVDIVSRNGKSGNVKMGLVVWNTGLDKILSVPPTSSFDKIKENIMKIKIEGNTCLGVGLQSAIEMLKETDINDKRIILLASNGIEEYCNNSVNACRVSRDAQKSGITVYTVGKGDASGNLTCIADRNKFYDISKQSLREALDSIAADIFNNTLEKGNSVTVSDSKIRISNKTISNMTWSDPFNLKARSNIITSYQPETNVTITKTIKEGPNGPRVVIDIMAPNARYIDKDILFAIDSSGSIALENYDDEINQAMQKVLTYLNNRELGENINISVLSWDNNIDFAYGNLSNKELNTTVFVPVSQAEREFGHLMNNSFVCEETEPTILGQGLNGSFQVLYNDPNKNNPKNMRMLIFIVGKSEFENWTPNSYFDKNIPLFTFGIGIDQFSKMNASLCNIASLGKLGYRIATPHTVEPSLMQFIRGIMSPEKDLDLGDEIIELLNIAIYGNIVKDLTIEDSVNPYFKLDNASISINGEKEGFEKILLKNNEFIIKMPKSLKPGSVTEISYDLKLNFTIPLGNTIKNEAFPEMLALRNEPFSRIAYTWQNGKQYEVILPENYINIFS